MQKPDHGEYSTSFLKYVYRILSKFPIPDMGRQPLPNNADKNWYLRKNQYGLDFARNIIQPYFNTKESVNNQRPREFLKQNSMNFGLTIKDGPLISSSRMVWITPKVFGPATKDVTNFYTDKSQRKIGDLNPDQAPWADLNLLPPLGLDTSELTQRITENEVEKTLRTAPNRSAPGHDRLTYVDYKLSNVIQILTSIFNSSLANCKIPSDWKHPIIKLIPKSSTDAIDLSEWRLISKLVTIYKVFMSIIGKRVISWIVETNRLSSKQKGSLPRNGLQEHVFCLNSAITDFKHQSGKMFVMFLDLANAFGSIDHQLMINSLHCYGYPDALVNLTSNIYNNSTFQVETKYGLTEPILRQRGIIQGCPYSVIAFEQGIDIWLRYLNENSAVP